MKVSIFLRKKIIGQNSLEELANNIVTGTSYSQLCIFPEYFSSIKGIIKNIIYVKKNTGDINHFFQPAGAFLCFFLRNTIVTYHDIFTLMEDKTFFQKYFRVLMYIIVPCVFAKKITCVSNITKSDLEKYAPRFSLKKIQIIYNVNMNNITYSDHKFNSNNPTILHIGTADRKNLLRLIKALSGIKCYLVIVGILSEKQTKLLEEEYINYINYFDITYLKILELYKNCDIVSFPSLAEGFGIIIIEAQKTGRCILSSNINIIREVGGNGYLSVDPYNIEDIRNGFLKIINDAPLRKRIINDGLNNVKRFTYEIFINSYKELYENLG